MKLSYVRQQQETYMKENLEEIYELLIKKDRQINDEEAAKLSNFKDRIELFLSARHFDKVAKLFDNGES